MTRSDTSDTSPPSADKGLRPLTPRRFADELQSVLLPRLRSLLDRAEPGHCLRVVDIDADLSGRLTTELRKLVESAEVHVLVNEDIRTMIAPEVAISATGLVERRNAMAEKEAPRALLVFIPPGTHTSAEDSFGVSTFAEVDLGDPVRSIVERRRNDLPERLRTCFDDMVDVLDDESWTDVHGQAMARYLLTCALNAHDVDAAGAALYELGLVPDFTVFRESAVVRRRIRRNIEAMRVLSDPVVTERQRVLKLELPERSLRVGLSRLLADSAGKVGWLRRIATEESQWPLNFSQWKFGDGDQRDAITVEVTELSALRAGDKPDDVLAHEVLQRITGQHYLLGGPRGTTTLSVSFRCDPAPHNVASLAKILVEIRRIDGGPAITTIMVKPNRKAVGKATLRKLTSLRWDEGWHVVRVIPVDAENVPLELKSPDPQRPLNQSEPFYVIPDGETDEPPTRSVRTEVGLTQALRRHQIAAVRASENHDQVRPTDVRVDRTSQKSTTGAEVVVLAQFGRRTPVRIPVSAALADAQRRITSDPGRFLSLRIDLDEDEPVLREAEAVRPQHLDNALVESFIRARTAVFNRLAEGTGLLEGTDLGTLRPHIKEYVTTYSQLLTAAVDLVSRTRPPQVRQSRQQLAGLLCSDAVQVGLADKHGKHLEITLVAPTHPLRLLWLAGWNDLAQDWISRIPNGARAEADAAEHGLLSVLQPLGFPFTVPHPDGTLRIAADQLGPYWGVYLPANLADRNGVLDSLRRRLAVHNDAADDYAEMVARLAKHLDRYLRLHPYVTRLSINVINPSADAAISRLVTSVNQSMKSARVSPVTWEVRLFVPNPEDPGYEAVAGDLAGLLQEIANPHTSPVALVPLRHFREQPESYAAHVTIMFDAFGAQSCDSEMTPSPTGNASVHGLALDLDAQFVADGTRLTWKSSPRAGRARPIGASDELAWLRSELPTLTNHAACVVATGEADKSLVPVVNIALDGIDRALLHEAQRGSDWVVTVDRMVGVEFFDQPDRLGRRDYVIDYSPEPAGGLDHRIVVTARAVEELAALLTPVLIEHQVELPESRLGVVFDQLRLLSERVTLRLAGAPPAQRTEILGLALARLYLGYRGALSDNIVVPLDAHVDLFAATSERPGDDSNSCRTDLALFAIDPHTRTLTCQLVEVKCYTSLDGIGAVNQLADQACRQLARSVDVLIRHFDAQVAPIDRPDRALKNRQLRGMLLDYLDRAERHGTVTPTTAARSRSFLHELDDGFHLAFTRSALIFDLARNGSSVELREGVEFHYIGRSDVDSLIDAIPDHNGANTNFDTTGPALADVRLTVSRDSGSTVPAGPDTTANPPSVAPTLGDAEESRPERDHSTASEEEDTEPIVNVPTAKKSAAIEQELEFVEQRPDIVLGTMNASPQFGVIGRTAGRTVAIDLNETHTISLFGVQGSGKSYTLGSLIEMASLPAEPVNHLPSPLSTIVFHYSPTQDYAPEFTTMTEPNDSPGQVKDLWEQYGGHPAALTDVVLLVPEDKCARRTEQYPDIAVLPLKFGSAELQAAHWKMLMGAVGNQSTYIRQLTQIMRSRRHSLTLDAVRDGVNASALPDHLKQLAHQRLELASTYIDDEAKLSEIVKPGQLIIVDLRDEFIEKDEALGLFVVLMQLFAEARDGDVPFNKLVVFDEAHKYIDSPDLVQGLVETVREMRHKGMSILVASQDPPSVPVSLIELSDHIILHKFTSPSWLRHLQRANSALNGLTAEKLSSLQPGEAFVWAGKSSDQAFSDGAVRIRLRPRFTRHGGATRTAVQRMH